MLNYNEKTEVIKYLEENLKIQEGFIEDEADLVDKIYDVVKLDDLRECLEKMPCNEIGEIDVPQDPLVKEYSNLRREYNRAMDALDIINRIAKSAKE